MKLYTEEQVREAFGFWFDSSRIWTQDEVLEQLIPIKLPSDEEIEDEADNLYLLVSNIQVFTRGARWMRNKILNK